MVKTPDARGKRLNIAQHTSQEKNMQPAQKFPKIIYQIILINNPNERPRARRHRLEPHEFGANINNACRFRRRQRFQRHNEYCQSGLAIRLHGVEWLRVLELHSLETNTVPGLTAWLRPGHESDMAVAFNSKGQDNNYNICTTQQADVLGLFPGNDGRKSVVRWKAPAGGTYRVEGRFQDIDQTTSDIAIVQNGTPRCRCSATSLMTAPAT
jgi:hypothetical protein